MRMARFQSEAEEPRIRERCNRERRPATWVGIIERWNREMGRLERSESLQYVSGGVANTDGEGRTK